MRTADLECEWQVAPSDKGRPALVSARARRQPHLRAPQHRAPGPPGAPPCPRMGLYVICPRFSRSTSTGRPTWFGTCSLFTAWMSMVCSKC